MEHLTPSSKVSKKSNIKMANITGDNPDSSFRLQQACTANLQACSKLTQASKSPRDELAASLPCQTHCRHSKMSTKKTSDQNSRPTASKADVLTTRPDKL
ncbi:hypothetical protein AVEN_114370-1 [Araneus ventricosus]|uniref:Uncharacterized protein n=1 Tax=Araneus ventricosus TaxID=182803 RepID=A0A4Y2TGB6_ARAVE|nr:hypothetical protein AVEN_114370-1 [Araneus ventricosus]